MKGTKTMSNDVTKKQGTDVSTEVMSQEELEALLKDSMEGVQAQLPEIKIIHQGQLFEMPGGETVKIFQGIIIDSHCHNAYWIKSLNEGGEIGDQPDCYSTDSIKPVSECVDFAREHQLGEEEEITCRNCEFNQFDSGKKGRGKACHNMRDIHVIIEGNALPQKIKLSSTNLSRYNKHVASEAGKAIPVICAVVTEFSLSVRKNEGAPNSATICMKTIGELLPRSAILSYMKLAKDYKDIMHGTNKSEEGK